MNNKEDLIDFLYKTIANLENESLEEKSDVDKLTDAVKELTEAINNWRPYWYYPYIYQSPTITYAGTGFTYTSGEHTSSNNTDFINFDCTNREGEF